MAASASSNILALTSQILAFLGFLATCIAIIRYLNPGAEYIVLADLVGQVRQIWTEHESQGMKTDSSTRMLLSTLERLEDEARDLLFVMNKKSVGCQIRAWANSFRIKRVSKRAQLVRIGLPLIIQMNKDISEARKNPGLLIEDLVTVEKMCRSRAEFMDLIEAEDNTILQIPPVRWTPTLESLPLSRIDTTSSNGTDTLFEPVTPPKTVPMGTGKLSTPRKRSILTKLISGFRKKRNSYDSTCSV